MHPQRIRAKKNADQREALLKQARAERDLYRNALEQLVSEVARKALTDSTVTSPKVTEP
jgi:DNA transposition AAA+ family ATPase